MEGRTGLQYLWLVLKGMAMGAADVVPGVSGGTIAFISGIYEELIASINGIRPSLLGVLKNQGFRAFWKQLNGGFLLAVLSGIAISVLSLAKGISWLLTHQPTLLWSFFFGLVLASVIYVAKGISRWNLAVLAMGIAGAVLAYAVVSLPVSQAQATLPYLFLSGALAICAMILPGISGAFILVLLGSYKTVLDAVHQRDLQVILVVGAGAAVGLLSFARLLKWMFSKFKNATLALLTGFIIGSLPKIWPWKVVLESQVFDGKEIPLRETVVAPWNYPEDPQWIPALGLAILGFWLIFILERLATKKNS
jgi:putative membrane protein